MKKEDNYFIQKIYKTQCLQHLMVRVETPTTRRRNPALTFGVKGEVDLRPTTDSVEKVLKQTGSVKSLLRDASRQARPPGKRISKTGNIYWETRKNRSDQRGKNI